MTVRRDHVAAVALLAFGIFVFWLGGDLPLGTASSPGPGLLPTLAAGLMMALAAVIMFQAGESPPFASIAWDDLCHALVVFAAACAAAGLYETLGFPITIGLLLFGLIYGIERMPLTTSLAITIGITGGTYLLLGTLLKTPMPRGILGF